jgi:hypothetical protein
MSNPPSILKSMGRRITTRNDKGKCYTGPSHKTDCSIQINCDKKKIFLSVRFQFLTAASMGMVAFWDRAPCSVAGVDRRSHEIVEVVRISEPSAYFNNTARHYIPEGYHLNIFNSVNRGFLANNRHKCKS